MSGRPPEGVWTLGLEGAAGLDPLVRGRVVALLVEALAEVDLEYLRARPGTPSLYGSGVRYRESPTLLADVATVLRLGEADCKSLAAWRIAELRRDGTDARARVAVYPDGRLHVEVDRGGSREDPSAFLERAPA